MDSLTTSTTVTNNDATSRPSTTLPVARIEPVHSAAPITINGDKQDIALAANDALVTPSTSSNTLVNNGYHDADDHDDDEAEDDASDVAEDQPPQHFQADFEVGYFDQYYYSPPPFHYTPSAPVTSTSFPRTYPEHTASQQPLPAELILKRNDINGPIVMLVTSGFTLPRSIQFQGQHRSGGVGGGRRTRFILKELGIASGSYYKDCISFQAECPFDNLTTDHQHHCSSVTKHTHSIPWNSGTFTASHVPSIMTSISLRFPNATYFAWGKNASSLLTEQLGKRVYNIKELEWCPTIAQLLATYEGHYSVTYKCPEFPTIHNNPGGQRGSLCAGKQALCFNMWLMGYIKSCQANLQ